MSAGEFYTHLARSNAEKLTEMHSTLRNLLFPTSPFLISSQKEDEQRKRKEEENQRIAAGHGSNGGERGKAQVRAASDFPSHCEFNSLTVEPQNCLQEKGNAGCV